MSLASFLERLYRSTLWIYPAGFRTAFGREMTDAFSDSSRQVRRRGRIYLLAHGIHAVGESLIHGVLEQFALLRRAGRGRPPSGRNHGGGRGADRRRMRGVLESLLMDALLALRGLRKNPGFAATVVIVLAVCIGANTAIFSVVNGVLLKPLPYPDSDRLVNVWQVNNEWLDSPDPRFRDLGWEFPASFPVLNAWVDHAKALENVGGYSRPELRTMDLGDRVERVRMAHVTSGVFSALRVPPLIGRAIVDGDDEVGAAMVAVLSHRFWQSHYGEDSTVVGRTISLDDRTYRVVGVTPPGFYFPDPDCVLLASFPDARKQAGRGNQFLRAVGRLRPGLTLDAAQREMEAMKPLLVEARRGRELSTRLNSVVTQVVGDVRPVLLVLLGAVALVLLIACANTAGLVLMRATSRRRELALRAALGADRGRLLRQLLVESLTVGVLSGMLGLGFAFATLEPMLARLPQGLPRLEEVTVDYRVLLFSFGVSLLTGLLVGIVPALSTSRLSFAAVLKEGGRFLTGDIRRRRIQGALVTAEIALAFVILIGSGLLLRSFLRLTAVERGFNPADVLTLAIALPQDRYADRSERVTFLQLLEERLSALPGVRSVAHATDIPFVGGTNSRDVTIEKVDGLREVNLQYSGVSPEYFQTLGIPLLAGRAFGATDVADTEPVAIISAAAANEHWPGEDPVGRRMQTDHLDDERPGWTVVGVVGDARIQLDREARPKFYIPVAQSTATDYVMIVKTATDPDALTASVRSALLDLEPNVPVPTVSSLERRIAGSVATPRLQTMLVTGLAALAVLLALVGVYAVLSYATAQRTAELGVRIALGARDLDIRRDVLGSGAALVALGLLIGFGVALGAVRVLESLLFQTEIYDPPMFLGAAVLLGLAALTASYVPARRATRVDPVEALRAE